MTEAPKNELERATRALEVINLSQGDLAGKEVQARLWGISEAFSRSSLIPSALQGKPYDIQILLDHALRSGQTPLTMLRSVYVVPGSANRPAQMGFTAEFYISQLRRHNVIEGTIHYETEELTPKMIDNGGGKVPDIAVTAYARDSASGEFVKASVTMRTALAERWAIRKKEYIPSKYETLGEQMLKYRAAVYLIRSHYPETLMGFGEKYEMQDIRDAEAYEVATKATAALDRLNTPPSQRPIHETATEPTSAEVDLTYPADAAVSDAPIGDADPDQISAIVDWMTTEECDEERIRAEIHDRLGLESVDQLSKKQAAELLDQIDAGEYAHPIGDGGLFPDHEDDAAPEL